jgi:hypothetical protein
MRHLHALLCVAVAACSAAELAREPGPASATLETCQTAQGTAGPTQRSAAQAVLRALAHGPFLAAGAGASVATCTLDMPGEGQTRIDVRFRDGNTLVLKSDVRIELFELTAFFVMPPAQTPLALLADAERAAYGSGGCGIDWSNPEIRPAAVAPAATESVYLGAACNCQAIVRRDAAGQVTTLSLKSAC